VAFTLVYSAKIIGQAEVIVIERLVSFHRIVRSGFKTQIPSSSVPRHWTCATATPVAVPRITCDSTPPMDLRAQVLSRRSQPVITKAHVTIDLDAVVSYRIADPQDHVRSAEATVPP
jgi:regulator of protease activity HflC (stomatin/prohibitin superfamily)